MFTPNKTEPTEYLCPLSSAVFKHPCTVTACFAHMSNLNQSNVHPIATTNCAHADFALAGYSETLDYAVEEQGFIGFRDLQYLAPFLQVNPNDLRDIYQENVAKFRKAVAILWAANNNAQINYCKHCGHPTKAGSFACISSSMCTERYDAISDVAEPYVKVVDIHNHLKVFNVIWRSLTSAFSPAILLSDDERQLLDDLRGR